MTLHAFLILWHYYSQHRCYADYPWTPSTGWRPFFEGQCTQAFALARQVGGAWFGPILQQGF